MEGDISKFEVIAIIKFTIVKCAAVYPHFFKYLKLQNYLQVSYLFFNYFIRLKYLLKY